MCNDLSFDYDLDKVGQDHTGQLNTHFAALLLSFNMKHLPTLQYVHL